MVLYIDCRNRKTCVTEIMRKSRAGGYESNNTLRIEVDIETIEQHFNDNFFDIYMPQQQ